MGHWDRWGKKDLNLCNGVLHLSIFFFSLSGHMLNERSTNLEQFMDWQTWLLYLSIAGDIWSASGSKMFAVCFPLCVWFTLTHLSFLWLFSPTIIYQTSIWSVTFVSSVRAFLLLLFSQKKRFNKSSFQLFLSPLIHSAFFFPLHLISIFSPIPIYSLSPYSKAITWIIQRNCTMIMGN